MEEACHIEKEGGWNLIGNSSEGGGPAFGTKRGTKWGIKELICWLRKLIISSTFGPFL